MSTKSRRARKSAAAAAAALPSAGAECPGSRSTAPDLAALPPIELAPVKERIARRAREIWEAKGRPNGEDLSIWLSAEGEVLALPR